MNPISLGAAFSFLAVALGAFGAHALKNALPPHSMSIFHTSTQYLFLHALGLLGFGLFRKIRPGSLRTAWFFVAGIALFSGSLYALAFTGLEFLGLITPIGGLCFLAGWLTFALQAREPKGPKA